MNNDFESVLSALLTSLSSVGGFNTVSRRLVIWTDPDLAQPALFVRNAGPTDDYQDKTIFARTALDVEVWIYCKADPLPALAPDITFNGLVKAVRDKISKADSPTGKFTIGGLVNWCRIQGKSDSDPGDTDGQCKLVMTLKIILP